MVVTGKYWSIVLTLCGASVAAVAAQQALTEAPTGFDTPTLVENPGSRSPDAAATDAILRLAPGVGLIVVLFLTIGLWGAVWLVVSALGSVWPW